NQMESFGKRQNNIMHEKVEEFSFKSLFIPFTTLKAIHWIIVIGLVVYFNSLFNGYVADDAVQIFGNPIIKGFNISAIFLGSSYYIGNISSLSGIYYKPVFIFLISLIYQIAGNQAFLFHLFQLCIHIANAILIFIFLSKFFKKNLAFFLSLVFLVHPGNVESVVYISDLQDVLFVFWGLIAFLIAYKATLSLKRIIIVSIFLLLSLLSKETGVLFLPVIFLITLIYNKKYSKEISYSISSVFFAYLALRLGIAHIFINKSIIAPVMTANIYTRLLTMPKIIYSYIILFFFPKNLWWGQHWLVKSIDLNNFFIPIIFIFIFGFFTTWLFKKIKGNKEDLNVFFLFSAILIFGLIMHMQFIPLDFTFAERWIYFPMIGFLGLLGIAIKQFSFLNINKTLVLLLCFVILTSLSLRSIVRTTNWQNDFTLALHDSQVAEDSFVLENNLGHEFFVQNKFELAKIHLQKSIEIYPTEDAYNILASTYSKLGEKYNSLIAYKKALAMGDYYLTYQNYIAELLRQGKYKEASMVLETAIKKYPNNPKIWLLESVYEYYIGNKDKAIQAAETANNISPGIGNYIIQKIENNEKIEL
ncbi:MAG TPA: hypothetical protein VF189_03175, partial [Patescibacteria group bacterium]